MFHVDLSAINFLEMLMGICLIIYISRQDYNLSTVYGLRLEFPSLSCSDEFTHSNLVG